jgi:hypothetical protein
MRVSTSLFSFGVSPWKQDSPIYCIRPSSEECMKSLKVASNIPPSQAPKSKPRNAFWMGKSVYGRWTIFEKIYSVSFLSTSPTNVNICSVQLWLQLHACGRKKLLVSNHLRSQNGWQNQSVGERTPGQLYGIRCLDHHSLGTSTYSPYARGPVRLDCWLFGLLSCPVTSGLPSPS